MHSLAHKGNVFPQTKETNTPLQTETLLSPNHPFTTEKQKVHRGCGRAGAVLCSGNSPSLASLLMAVNFNHVAIISSSVFLVAK